MYICRKIFFGDFCVGACVGPIFVGLTVTVSVGFIVGEVKTQQ